MLEMYNALILFGALLIGGVVIRELVPPLQKALLPASLIGGFLGLILGPQVLGLIEIPTAFVDIASFGMRIMMACVPIGVTVNAKRIYYHLDFTFANMTVYGFQMIFGILLGGLFFKFWPGLPEGWGVLGVAAFFGSHGSIPVVSDIIDPSNAAGVLSIGMVLATIGVLIAIIPGMVITNYGARKGYTTFTKDITEQPKYFFRGTLPDDKRTSLGNTTVNPTNVTGLALQLGIIALAINFGTILFKQVLIPVIPLLGKVSPMLYGLIGGYILWPIMKKVKLQKYVDKPTINSISNFTLEMIILGACATIRLDIVSKLFVPLILFSLILCTVSAIFIFGWLKMIGHPQWFEKAIMVYGMTSGSNPQGLSLIRAIDPDNKSSIYEALGVYNAVFFWNYLVLPFAATMVLFNRVPIYMVGIGLMSTAIIGTIMFSRDKKVNTNNNG